MIANILVPVDFSPLSEAAITYAVKLAKAVGARLYLLHVPGETGENIEASFPVGQFEIESRGRFGQLLPAQDSAQLRPEYASRIGKPATEIVRYAGARDCDLIVMGTHGRSGIAHALMGSVAEQVVRTSPCPVLLLRQPSDAVAKAEAAATASSAARSGNVIV